MIVSGFTQRTTAPTDEDLAAFSGFHSHCFRCRQANCKHTVDNVIACAMTVCQACRWKFHECKAEEHTLMCQEERVACINAVYGCPHMLKRSSLPTHLPVCPASVVCCGEEWSRWPMYTKEKGVRHSLPPSKNYIDCGQLDVALAMRDQRMLIDSLRAPSKLKRSLRNPLTQKYPAAPLTHRSPSLDSSDLIASGDTSQTVSDDDTDAPWNLTRRQPGLRESISSHFVSVSQETKESLMTALNNKASSLSPSLASPLAGINEEGNDNDNNSKLASCNITKYAKSHQETFIEKSGKDNHSSLSPMRSVRNSVSSERELDRSRSRSVSVLHDVGGSQLHKILGVKLGDESEDGEICLHKILGVSLTLDVINRYVGKPASMYNFICAQNFRRDQYKWHFKNVHEDILSQLEGYLVHRCPLAYAGCTFSFERLVPSQPDTVLHFSSLQESFGLKSLAQPYHRNHHSSNINDNESESAECSKETSPPNETASSQNVNNDQLLNTNTNNVSSSSNYASNSGPSISDLGNIDRDFDQLKVNVNDDNDNGIIDFRKENRSSASPSSQTQQQQKKQPETKTSIQPVVYTACNPDSKVLLVYNVEEEVKEEACGMDAAPLSPSSSSSSSSSSSCFGLTDLPFEILQQIARRVDSFSLCNLSLTNRLLRDVCCSLLDDLGIVMLNWERQKVGDRISWKVANKRWIFSTSFEPIASWKMNEDHVSITDHLKVCPFNQDKLTHSLPLPMLSQAS